MSINSGYMLHKQSMTTLFSQTTFEIWGKVPRRCERVVDSSHLTAKTDRSGDGLMGI
jgi:hypothetical protein